MTAATNQTNKTSVAKKGHPIGLAFLFGTEMWERFSYYGMRSILVYYMTKRLMFSQEKSSQIYGIYTGLVYLTPFFGGYIADRYLGQRKSVVVGAILMTIGECLMMFENTFYLALTFLIVGNGFFKPNISTQVGGLYEHGDPRRDRAFSIFYVGINVGATLSPLICGTLGERIDYKWGFASAAVGMLAGLLIYLWGQKHLAPDYLSKASASATPVAPKLTREEKSRIWALVVICVLNVIFWATYEQQGNTLALWADANTDRFIFGWEMPASWVQMFNPVMIAVFTPFIIAFWAWQQKRGKDHRASQKWRLVAFCLAPRTWL